MSQSSRSAQTQGDLPENTLENEGVRREKKGEKVQDRRAQNAGVGNRGPSLPDLPLTGPNIPVSLTQLPDNSLLKGNGYSVECLEETHLAPWVTVKTD